MTINFNQGLIGLSLLSGTNLGGLQTPAADIETRAARTARAQFTLKPVTPPWNQPQTSPPLSVQVATIRSMSTIIDSVRQIGPTLPPDVQTAFTTYKALDRLRVLAQTAMRQTSSVAERTSLQTTFARGIADLQAFLASAPGDKLSIAFGQPARRAESVEIAPPTASQINGEAVVQQRAAALPGLTGTERFSITLNRGTGTTTDTVTVDLAGTPQPPTLDSIAEAFSAAIAAIPQRDTNGDVVNDAEGNPLPRWPISFKPVKTAGGWGLQMNGTGIDRVTINQIGAGDSLMVAAGQTPLDSPTATSIMRFDDPTGAIERNTLASYSAIDAAATARAQLTPPPKPLLPDQQPEPVQVAATTRTRAVATDAQGFTYMVGTTAGDLGSNRSDGEDDLFLTKMDSDGKVIWQRALGAGGTADGAAISIAGNGDIVVAGTVTGAFDGADSDGDMLVARFSAAGEERFATVVRSIGADSANAVAVGNDGSVFVGGRAASGTGDAFLARLDATGRLQERRTINSGSSDAVRALRVDSDGSLVALTSEGGNAVVRRMSGSALSTDLGQISLGQADARALAIGSDGTIAVAGATSTAITGDAVNTLSGARDGFVTRLNPGLSNATTSYVGTGADDQIDSLTFMGGTLYVGGRTTGDLGGTRAGPVDGFVARVNSGTGAVENVNQWGRAGVRTEAVQIAAAPGADTAIGAFGFRRGTINPEDSTRLTAQTSLRPGDEFSFRVNGGAVRRITIAANDTLTSLADRIRLAAGRGVTVATPRKGEGSALRIEAQAGNSIELISGRDGRDALEKLGMTASKLVASAPIPDNAPRVRPGGNYGLDLSSALDISTLDGAKLALSRIEAAVSTSQTAFRSLFWDKNKEAIVNGSGRNGRVSPYLAAQASRYQDALRRLGGGSVFTGF